MSTNYLAQFSANLSTISAVNINYSTLVGSTIIASSITTNSTINVSSITSRTINYSTLMGSTLTAQLINYSTLTGSTIVGNSVSIASTIITSSILTNGTVGIGTNTPNAPLQFSNTLVNRKIVLYEDTNNDNQFFGFGVNSFILRYQVSATTVSHVFYAGTSSSASTELMRIMGTGNVGIGTATPNAKLDINSSSTTSFIMQALISGEAYALSSSLKSTYSPAGSIMTIGTTNGVASAGALIDFATQGTSGYTNVYAGGVAGSGANGPSNFVIGRRTGAVSWAESLRIDTAGNVGIGTNNPYSLMHVAGSSTGTISLLIANTNGAVNSSAALNFGLWSASGSGSGTSSSAAQINAICQNNSTGQTDLAFSTYTGNLVAPTAFTLVERMRITATGNVGIGTNNPGFPLDVNGISVARTSFFINNTGATGPSMGITGGSGDKLILYPGTASFYPYSIGIAGGTMWFSMPGGGTGYIWYNNGNQIMSLSSAGALTVGPAVLPVANSVGTTNLIVYGNINCYRNRLIFSSAATDWNHSIYNNSQNLDNEGIWDGMKFNVYDGAWFRVGATRTTAMYINSSGSVGIGTTNPAALLSIVEPGATQTGNFSSLSTCTLSGNGAAYYSVWDGARSGAFGCDSGSNYVFTGSLSSHDYVIRTNNYERIRVGATTGNVSVSGALSASSISTAGTLTGNSITSTTGTFNTSNSGGSMQILYYQIGHGGTVDFSNLLSYGSGRFFIVTLTNNYGGSAQTQGACYILFLPINHGVLQGAPAVLTQLYAAGGVSLTYTSAPATFTVYVNGQAGFLTLLRIGV